MRTSARMGLARSGYRHGVAGIDPPLAAPGARPAALRRERRRAGPLPSVLVARRGGAAERFSRALGGRHPAATFFAALIVGIAVISGLSILAGLLVVHVLLGSAGL